MIQATAAPTRTKTVRCAIYTRKSHEEGLEQEFNSLHAQREAGEAYIASQRHAGWVALPTDYGDGGFSGGTTERPALQKLLTDIQRDRVDCVVVYKVDRLSRSLMDFAQMISLFEKHNVSFVSVTQHFDTSTSMGRLILNVLLSFAQFEREIIGERIRDKKLATARQGKYIGGPPFLGYDIDRERKCLVVNEAEAKLVREIFETFLRVQSQIKVAAILNAKGYRTKQHTVIKNGKVAGGKLWDKITVIRVLANHKYIGEIVHKGKSYPGQHRAILDRQLWDEVQKILSRNKDVRAGATRRAMNPSMLRGVIRCGHCSTLMGSASSTCRGGKTYRYYVCNNAERQGYEACPVPSVPAGDIEAAVRDRLHVIFRSPDVIARTMREARAQDLQRRAEVTEQNERLEARRADLEQAINRGRRSESDAATAVVARLNEEYLDIQRQIQDATSDLAAMQDGGPSEDEVREALLKLEPLWDELFPLEKSRIISLLVHELVVDHDGLLIRVRLKGLESLVDELVGDGQAKPAVDGETLDIHVPMELKMRAGRRQIILPEPGQTQPKAEPNPVLVKAVARAFHWQRMLDSGQASGMEAIAAQHDMDRAYVARILGLAMLAPDIVTAIVKGTEPSGMSLRKLTAEPLPVRWDDQRSVLAPANSSRSGCASQPGLDAEVRGA